MKNYFLVGIVFLHCCAYSMEKDEPSSPSKKKMVVVIGPSQSGKSTLIAAIKQSMARKGFRPFIIDKDNVKKNELELNKRIQKLSIPAEEQDEYKRMSPICFDMLRSLKDSSEKCFYLVEFCAMGEKIREELNQHLLQLKDAIILVKLKLNKYKALKRYEKNQKDTYVEMATDHDNQSAVLYTGRKLRVKTKVEENYANLDGIYTIGKHKYDLTFDTTKYRMNTKVTKPKIRSYEEKSHSPREYIPESEIQESDDYSRAAEKIIDLLKLPENK